MININTGTLFPPNVSTHTENRHRRAHCFPAETKNPHRSSVRVLCNACRLLFFCFPFFPELHAHKHTGG